ncbi:marine proteobacterial sortase target protein [Alteromonas sp. IB21]|uniref:marine proteobacterial sortase target protein n=1 Tax=Alteromonas sp. IB21 TaxID=2779369 RepID=UPI0018E8AF5F|nr:marine proteobacterial sortase target protein [Alteromonas sp. IB21]MBJ2131001.1 marine proteobacterial sortase target protein [Alteromonas sp. IB21]
MLFSKTPKRDYFNPPSTYKPWFRERQRAAQPSKHRLLILVSFLCFLLGLMVSPLSRAESGELILQSKDGEPSHALLHSTDVDLQVNGMIAHVTYSQKFTNNSNEWKHAVYTFPLNENAAINSMEMLIGKRIVRGKIKQKTEAKKAFETAKKAGKKASLTEQQRPNLFTQHVANIAPGEDITVTLQYIQQVAYENGEFSFHLPTTLTPRYIPGIPTKDLSDTALVEHAYAGDSETNDANEERRHSENKSERGSHSHRHITADNAFISGWALPTNEVSDADKITPFMIDTLPQNNLTNQLTFKATINAGLAINSIYSKGHQVQWHSIDDTKYQYRVLLDDTQITMDRDLWLHWSPLNTATPQAAYFAENVDNNHYALVMLTPPQVNPKDLQDFPRDVTFVIDTSGSMGGRPIEDAKAALKLAIERLDTKDRFNIVAFSSNYTKLFSQPTNTQPHNINTALSFISRLNANGGTEMADALHEALKAEPKENFIKQVVFITDGAVGNEAALFSLIKRELGSARLFTVGIGSAPNSYFMTRAAQFGRGSYVFINDTNNIQKKMQRLFTKLESPVLSNLSLILPKSMRINKSVEVFPERLPDLYAGEPLLINFKVPDFASIKHIDNVKGDENSLDNQVVLTGTLTDTNGNLHKWQRSVEAQYLTAAPQNNGNAANVPFVNSSQTTGIATAWARKKIAALMDEKALGRNEEDVEKDILKVAIPHKLITAYTSFVAIEETESRPESTNASPQHVENLMPQGMQMRAISYPQTSAGINQYLVTSALSLFLLMLLNIGETRCYLFAQYRIFKEDKGITHNG